MPHQDKIALEIENKLTDILRAISADVGINTTVRHALLSLYQQGVEDGKMKFLLEVGVKKFSKDFIEQMDKLSNE